MNFLTRVTLTSSDYYSYKKHDENKLMPAFTEYNLQGFELYSLCLAWHGKLAYLITSMWENSVVDTAADEYGDDKIISLGF